MTDLQPVEGDLLRTAIADAAVRAVAGDVAGGYGILVAGRRRIEELLAAGENGVAPFRQGYIRAQEEYLHEYGSGWERDAP